MKVTEEEQKVIDDNVARLIQGAEVWNRWYKIEDRTAIDLRGANLSNANLCNTILDSADLSYSTLVSANLCNATLRYTNLSCSNLNSANLACANLDHANLSGANLACAVLSNTSLFRTKFCDANLCFAELSGANLCFSDLSRTYTIGIKWHFNEMRGNFQGIRGIESIYGNALFKRAAADQDYLDTLEETWRGDKTLTYLFKIWGWIDYGRSFVKVILIALSTIILFGTIYFVFPEFLGIDCLPNTEGCSRHSWFTPFYFSIVTFTTLGFGDVTPKNLYGELVVSLEVVLGYLVLGLLISVLADKVVRRS